MNYVKKMCILRQVKQGFSGDGKALSGLIKAEQYGKNLAVEVSIINFAPLLSGEYYCLLSDDKARTELLPLRGKSIFNILTDMDISDGFCAVICFVKTEIIPIAYGINGNHAYDWKQLLNATLPPSFSQNATENPHTATAMDDGVLSVDSQAEAIAAAPPPPAVINEEETQSGYDDENIATENYYREKENGQSLPEKIGDYAPPESGTQTQDEKTGADGTKNDNAENVRHPFTTDSDGYYRSVKSEMDELLQRYPRDNRLQGAFSCSEWVRVKGDEENPQYLVGVVYDDGKAKYICYALATQDKTNPPQEIAKVCSFVPLSPYDDDKGFFVIFQSAATGECIKPVYI